MGLKGVPDVISPELLFVLSSMGHGDEIVLADSNFPTSSCCRNGAKELRADGHSVATMLEAILKLFPLDAYVTAPAAVMDQVPNDKAKGETVPVWPIYEKILETFGDMKVPMEKVERFAFYERAEKAYAILHTGESAKYGNIILVKGLVR